jgi:hypothetical protein
LHRFGDVDDDVDVDVVDVVDEVVVVGQLAGTSASLCKNVL